MPAIVEYPQVVTSVTGVSVRHQGKNAYTTVVANPLFASFTTTASKSRVNFLKLLRAPYEEYVWGEDALPARFPSRGRVGEFPAIWRTNHTTQNDGALESAAGECGCQVGLAGAVQFILAAVPAGYRAAVAGDRPFVLEILGPMPRQ